MHHAEGSHPILQETVQTTAQQQGVHLADKLSPAFRTQEMGLKTPQ